MNNGPKRPRLKRPKKPKTPTGVKQPRVVDGAEPTEAALSVIHTDDPTSTKGLAVTKKGCGYPPSLKSDAVVRQQAAVDYITDPEARSIDWHFARPDRSYRSFVPQNTFRKWSTLDRWYQRREQFWNEIERRVLEQYRERLLKVRFEEIEELTEIRKAYLEYMIPRSNEGGDWERFPDWTADGEPHPFAGLPMLPLPPTQAEKIIKAIIDLDTQLMKKRGEIVPCEKAKSEEGDGLYTIDSASNVQFTKDDLRAMAKAVLYRRQPELKQQQDDLIDVAPVDNDNDDDL